VGKAKILLFAGVIVYIARSLDLILQCLVESDPFLKHLSSLKIMAMQNLANWRNMFFFFFSTSTAFEHTRTHVSLYKLTTNADLTVQ
jgi:hypothetical protein